MDKGHCFCGPQNMYPQYVFLPFLFFLPSLDVSSIITSLSFFSFFLSSLYFSLFLSREGLEATLVRVHDAPCGAEVWQTKSHTWLTSKIFPLDQDATYTIQGIYSLLPSHSHIFSFFFLVFMPLTLTILSLFPLCLSLPPLLSPLSPLPTRLHSVAWKRGSWYIHCHRVRVCIKTKRKNKTKHKR